MLKHCLGSDIEPGEEIYIDYGDQWQAAWEKHIRQWKPPRRADIYRPAVELNEDTSHTIRTVDEGLYPDVSIMCQSWYRYIQGHGTQAQTEPCRAISRRNGQDGKLLYTAELYQMIETEIRCYEAVSGALFDVPREAFLFVDLPYSRDTHQPWAFRHAIGIPDEMMPESWKDRTKKLNKNH